MHASFTFSLLLAIVFAAGVVSAQPVKSRLKMPSCDAVCAGLAEAIRKDPSKLQMRVEDALVINEGCTAQIITAAIDAVNADPAKVRVIFETAMNVVPHRSGEVRESVVTFRVPSAVTSMEAEVEVRRAMLPADAPEFEVRRAESPDSGPTSEPIPEIRRALKPDPKPGRAEIRAAKRAIPLETVPKARKAR
ncbi:MAG: hypothetical protein JNG86_09920 [Verrucomicrobiaceae bacterium]|nr:hypothetical protein [Verrucomicrobiaceae bacterium]